MRIIFSFIFLFFFGVISYGQKLQYEVGFGLGLMTYTGDLTQSLKPRYLRPAAEGHFRMNMNDAISLRLSLLAGRIVGSDEKAPVDAFAANRNHDFGVYVFETAGVMEYHFFKWRENKYLRWTPYLFGGLGLFAISGSSVKKDYSSIQPVLPLGFGAKYILNPRHQLEFQFGLRKTFFDYLDNLSEGDLSRKDYQSGNWNDNDMYYYIGVAFTLSFYDIPCPKSPYN